MPRQTTTERSSSEDMDDDAATQRFSNFSVHPGPRPSSLERHDGVATPPRQSSVTNQASHKTSLSPRRQSKSRRPSVPTSHKRARSLGATAAVAAPRVTETRSQRGASTTRVTVSDPTTFTDDAAFFHYFETMTPVRVRLGVLPLPGQDTSNDGDCAGRTAPQPSVARRVWSALQASCVERFLQPRRFFQLPSSGAATQSEGTDILGWSGLCLNVPLCLPAVDAGTAEDTVTQISGTASFSVILSP